MRLINLSLTALLSAAVVPIASAEVSFLLNVDQVRDSAGDSVSTAMGSWIIVADTNQDGFSSVAPGSVGASDFVGGSDDLVIFRGDFTTFFTDGVVSHAATGLSFANGWDQGDPLAFVWFPEGGTSRAATSSGDSYGLFTSAGGQDSSDPWITPADNTLDHSLQLLTSDGNGFFGSGTVEPLAATAGLQVIPEPSAALLGMLSGLLLIRRRR